jgi:hypothetical protein
MQTAQNEKNFPVAGLTSQKNHGTIPHMATLSKISAFLSRLNPLRRITVEEDAIHRIQQADLLIRQCDSTIKYAEYTKQLAEAERNTCAFILKSTGAAYDRT